DLERHQRGAAAGAGSRGRLAAEQAGQVRAAARPRLAHAAGAVAEVDQVARAGPFRPLDLGRADAAGGQPVHLPAAGAGDVQVAAGAERDHLAVEGDCRLLRGDRGRLLDAEVDVVPVDVAAGRGARHRLLLQRQRVNTEPLVAAPLAEEAEFLAVAAPG